MRNELRKYSNEVMAKRIGKSLIFSIIALVAIFIVNFFLPRLMPGDPLENLIGADEKSITQEEYDALYREMGLDLPLGKQFANYVSSLFKGDWGYSYHQGRDVGAIIFEKIPRTLQITMPAWLLSALIACWLGLVAGNKKSRFADVGITSGMMIVDAVPSFLCAIVLLILFAFEWKVLPSGGLNSPFAENAASDRFLHLILPVMTLVLASTPKKYLLVRNQSANTMDEQYMSYARAKGLSNARLEYVHTFPNISATFISMLGTSFGHMIAGSIVIEKVFSIDGVGLLVSRAINDKDFPALQGALLIIAISVIVSNFVADVIVSLCDPRQRRAE